MRPSESIIANLFKRRYRRQLVSFIALAFGLWMTALPLSPDLAIWPGQGEQLRLRDGIVQAQQGNPLYSVANSVYRVLPGGDVVRVQVEVEVRNQDPTSVRQADGSYYYYDKVASPLPAQARNITVVSESGQLLNFERQADNGDWHTLLIDLGRELLYEDTARYIYTFDLQNVDDETYRVAPNIARFPGVLLGDEGVVRGEIPPAYSVDLESDFCSLRPGNGVQFVNCPSQRSLGKFVFYVNAVRPTELSELLSDPIPLANQNIRLKASFFGGERDWATEVIDVLGEALPVLEEVMGFPYNGPSTIELTQATSDETQGFSGIFEGQAAVLIEPSAPVEVIVHEGAHLWSTPFADRWIYEGWAEWAAQEAMRRLQIEPEYRRFALDDVPELDISLQDWVWRGAIETDERQEYETYGYTKSAAFLDALVEAVGLETLQQANRHFVSDPNFVTSRQLVEADSRSYLDAVEAQGADVVELWREWVFNERNASLLPERAAAQERAAELAAEVEQRSRQFPAEIERRLNDWKFESAQTAMDDAFLFLDALDQIQPLLEEAGWEQGKVIQTLFERGDDVGRTKEMIEQSQALVERYLAVRARAEAEQTELPAELQGGAALPEPALAAATDAFTQDKFPEVEQHLDEADRWIDTRRNSADQWLTARDDVIALLSEAETHSGLPGVAAATFMVPVSESFLSADWESMVSASEQAKQAAAQWLEAAKQVEEMQLKVRQEIESASQIGLPEPDLPALAQAEAAYAAGDFEAMDQHKRKLDLSLMEMAFAQEKLANAYAVLDQAPSLWLRLESGQDGAIAAMVTAQSAWVEGDFEEAQRQAALAPYYRAVAERQGKMAAVAGIGFVILLAAVVGIWWYRRRRVAAG